MSVSLICLEKLKQSNYWYKWCNHFKASEKRHSTQVLNVPYKNKTDKKKILLSMVPFKDWDV